MLVEGFKRHFENSLATEGDIIDFRVYDGNIGSDLCSFLFKNNINKHFYGLDTFSGLNKENKEDLNYKFPNDIKEGQFSIPKRACEFSFKNKKIPSENYSILEINPISIQNILNNKRFCFAILDLKQYLPTIISLKFLWDRMSYGGTIFIPCYNDSSFSAQDKAIKDFINLNANKIQASKQMLCDGIKEQFLAIKLYNPLNKTKHSINPKDEKISICMYYKSGGIYNHHYVNNLAKQIKKNVSKNHELICLTDDSSNFSSDIDRIEYLIHDFPTWWGKIELFRPNLFNTSKVFYIDLDTIIKSNIDEILSIDIDFMGLRDFYKLYGLGSGLLIFKPNKFYHIYNNFLPHNQSNIRNYKNGDQAWINEQVKTIHFFQDYFSNEIVSYKVHCIKQNKIKIPNSAKIICFHGNPRIHQINDPLIKNLWECN